jgi:hypothetical protein
VAAALAAPLVFRAVESWSTRRARSRRQRRVERRELRDPGRERRAEQRARELLRSCVNDEEWGMYRDLGFIRVSGQLARKGRGGARQQLRDELDGALGGGSQRADDPRDGGRGFDSKGDLAEAGDFQSARERADDRDGADDRNRAADGDFTAGLDPPRERSRGFAGARGIGEQAPYAYLIYPHKPIVAYVPKTGRLLSEYCVEFPDLTGAISQTRLPDSDDVLAKWMALTGDEERLIRNANMHLPGRQVDPSRVRRDLWRLSEWERQRRGYGPVRAPRT